MKIRDSCILIDHHSDKSPFIIPIAHIVPMDGKEWNDEAGATFKEEKQWEER